jgi:hypothetical protein
MHTDCFNPQEGLSMCQLRKVRSLDRLSVGSIWNVLI